MMNSLEATKALDRIYGNWSIDSSDKSCVFIDGAKERIYLMWSLEHLLMIEFE